MTKRGNCPFGVYMKDDVRKPYTSALFTEPRHMACEREECMMWRGEDCAIAAAALAVAGRGSDDGE